MRVITEIKYEANDGMFFDTEEECKEHEECVSYEHKLKKLEYLVNTELKHSMLSTFIYKNYAEIKEIMEDTTEVKAEVDWSEVPVGTVILVRNDLDQEWVERVFIKKLYYNNSVLCTHASGLGEVVWLEYALKE